MSPEEEFKLVLDAALSAIEAGLVEEPVQTKAALNNWYARATNENDFGIVVDWSMAPKWAQWFAVDENGKGWFYAEKPTASDFAWGFADMWSGRDVVEGSFIFEHWKKTLIERPKDDTGKA